MRLYRQTAAGDWTSLLDRVIHDARALTPLRPQPRLATT
jgi:hypothetical protein